MSTKVESLQSIQGKLREIVKQENDAKSQIERSWLVLKKWSYLLLHEFIKDDVRVRAESLAYLMMFSLLPLIAGFFFLLSVFSQLGWVQEAIQNLLGQIFKQIPELHREFVWGYLNKFKDLYLDSILKKSSTLGIFSLSFLGWIGLKVYNNIDSTLNHIWSSDRKRPFIEKVRNFVVVSTVAPIVLVAGVSLPLIVQQLALKHSLAAHLSPALTLMNALAPTLLILLALLAMYYYLPVEKMKWKSAFWGALAATVAIQFTNQMIQIYFKIGTETAYGKAAVFPILGLWIYFVWLVVILGAEISYLAEHSEDVIVSQPWTPSILECEGIYALLSAAYQRHKLGQGPVTQKEVQSITRLDPLKLKEVISVLIRNGFLVRCVDPMHVQTVAYVSARDLSQVSVDEVLKLFFQGVSEAHTEETSVWNQAIQAWFSVFKGQTFQKIAEQSQ